MSDTKPQHEQDAPGDEEVAPEQDGREESPVLIDPDAPKPGDPPEKFFEHLRLLRLILDDETDSAESRTALLGKGGMTATLTLKTTAAGGVTLRDDPRIPATTSRYHADAAEALRWYRRSLRSSKANGWTIHYVGAPARG
jgi:hypothetical protein